MNTPPDSRRKIATRPVGMVGCSTWKLGSKLQKGIATDSYEILTAAIPDNPQDEIAFSAIADSD